MNPFGAYAIIVIGLLTFGWIADTIMDYFMRKHSTNTGTFQKGDTVEAFGNIGTVHSIGVNGYLHVKFQDCDSLVTFRLDGRQNGWHKNVSLRKI